MDGNPEPQLPNPNGPSPDDSELDTWLDCSMAALPADMAGGDLIQGEFYDSSALTWWPEDAGSLIYPDNFGVSMPTAPGLDLSFSPSDIGFSRPGLPVGVTGDNSLQALPYVDSTSSAWQGGSGATTYPGAFEATMPEAVTSLEWSSHASSAFTPPSDWQGISPLLTPATSTLESPFLMGGYQENSPSIPKGTFFSPPLAPVVVPHISPLPLAPAEEKPKKPRNGKRRKRVAQTQREIRKFEKPEACRKCPQRFAYIRDLERHLPVHERKEGVPTERFGCPHCRSTFTLKHNLTRHLKNIHKDIYPRGPAS